MRKAGFGLLALVAAPAFAQSLPAPGPGEIMVSADGKIFISAATCQEVTSAAGAVPGADYQPSVDVNGNHVAPADLPSAAPAMKLDNFPIEINRKLAGAFNIPASGSIGAKAILGLVTIRDGSAYFNGEPMAEDQRAALVASCQAAKR
jgi:hypothetical protein